MSVPIGMLIKRSERTFDRSVLISLNGACAIRVGSIKVKASDLGGI